MTQPNQTKTVIGVDWTTEKWAEKILIARKAREQALTLRRVKPPGTLRIIFWPWLGAYGR